MERGLETGGNGVPVPTDGFNIGVNIKKQTGQFSSNGTENNLKYFFADNADKYIAFNSDHFEIKSITTGKKVNINQNEHGLIYVDKQVANEGDTVNVTVQSTDEEYLIKSVQYTPEGETAQTIDPIGNSYSFTMPNKTVTVSAEFEIIPPTITLYWGYEDSSKTLYLSATDNAITQKGTTANSFDSTVDGSEQSAGIPWRQYRSNIEHVEILNDIAPGNTAFWFYDMRKITEIVGIDHLKTDNVQNMMDMFGNCYALTSLDVGGFNTSKVTSMEEMFWNCYELTSLDVSKFDTSEVIDMESMFEGCKKLTSLDVSKFDTSKVMYMAHMFQNCNALTSLDVSKFDTSKVTSMARMFENCNALTSLDVSKFSTSNVQNMEYMFSGCNALASLDVSNFNTSSVQRMSYMFEGCKALTSLDVSNFNTSSVQTMDLMFSDCRALTSLEFSSFDTSKVTKMDSMFKNCIALKTLDLSNFDCINVTSASNMFQIRNMPKDPTMPNYSSIAQLKTPKNVKATAKLPVLSNSMIWYDASDNTVYGDVNLPKNLTQSKTLYACAVSNDIENGTVTVQASGDSTVIVTVTPSDGYALNKGSLMVTYNNGTGEKTITPSHTQNPDEYSFTMPAYPVTVTAIFVKDSVTQTLYWGYKDSTKTLYLSATDNAISQKGATADAFNSTYTYGNDIFPWREHREDVEHFVILNDIEPGSTAFWFKDMEKLTKIEGIEHLDTSNVWDMNSMFLNCESLESLDVSKFNTSNVTDMTYMFNTCYKLESIDVSKFDTSKVKEISCMFGYCKALTSLDLSSFDMSSVDSENGTRFMFYGCDALESVNLSNVDASNVKDMERMFQDCKALTSINFTNFKTSSVENMFYMFYGCEALTSLNLSSFDTSKVEIMTSMFYGCKKLKSLDLSNFNTSKVTSMNFMFSGCTSLKSLDLSSFDITSSTSTSAVFNNAAITYIKTPKNVPDNKNVPLPAVESPMKWCYADTLLAYEDTYLPKNLTESIALIAGIPIDGWTALQNAINATSGDATNPATKSTTFILSENLTASAGAKPIKIPAGKNITINLNGYVLDRGLIANDGTGIDSKQGSVIEVEGKGTLNIIDSNAGNKAYKFIVLESGLWKYAGEWGDGDTESDTVKKVTGGAITGGTGNLVHAGGVTVGEDFGKEGATFNMNGGTICGNMGASGIAGGVYVGNGHSFTMVNSSITGNTGGGGDTGGVCADKASFTMINSSITNNKTTGGGGGADIDGGSFTMINSNISGNAVAQCGGGVYCVGNATFTMIDSNITDNTAAMAGGAYVDGGSFKMTNSSITGNTASQMFGGAFIALTNDVILGGTTVIKDNSAGETASNLTLFDAAITLGTKTASTEGNGVPTPGGDMHIGVTKSDETRQPTTGKITNNGTRNDAKYFFPDSADFYVNFVDDTTDYLELKAKEDSKSISIPSVSGGAVYSDKQYVANDAVGNARTVTLTVVPNEDYQLQENSLKVTYNDGEEKTCSLTPGEGNTYTFTMPAYPVTVTAEFEKMTPLDETLYWGVDDSTKTLYFSSTVQALADKGATAISFDATKGYTTSNRPWNGSTAEQVEILNDIAPGSTASWFENMENITEIKGLEHLDLYNVTDMQRMFKRCNKLASIDLSKLNTSHVINMDSLFNHCYSIESIDLSKLNTSNVQNMSNMFDTCEKLTSVNLSKLDTSKVTNIKYMFSACEVLETVDLSGLDLSNVSDDSCAKGVFDGAGRITEIKTPKNLACNVELPTLPENIKWYNMDASETYPGNYLPRNASKSMTLVADFPAWTLLAEAFSGEGSYTAGKTIKYRGTDLATVKDETSGGATTRTIKLLSDISANADDTALVIPEDENIVLDLNGHVLNRGLIAPDGTPTIVDRGSVLEIEGGELIIKDSNPSAVHDGYIDAKGIWHMAASGHPATSENAQKIKGGIITGGTGYRAVEYFGGGIYANNGNITIEGGTIAGNLVQDNGGGIYTSSNCKLLMLDGSIRHNGTSKEGGCGGGINNLGDCTLRGGTITDNFSAYGGGVFNRDRLILEKTSITDNKATCGGGVYNLYDDADFPNAQIIVSGDAKITVKDNNSTKNDGHNIATDRQILINATLTKAEMFVTFNDSNKDETTNGQLTSGYIEKNPNAKLDDFFHYDGPNAYYLDWNDNNTELVVKKVPDGKNAVSIPSIPNGKVTTDKQIAASGDAVTLTIIPDEGFSVDPDSIKVIDKDGNKVDISANADGTFTFMMPEGNVSVEEVKFNPSIETWAKLQKVIDSAEPGDTIILTKNLVAPADGGPINISKDITIDLNGHIIDRGLSGEAKEQGNVIRVLSGEATIIDSKPNAKHKGYLDKDGLWHSDPDGSHSIAEDEESREIEGGIITGGNNVYTYEGGGIFVGENGTLNLNGGTVAGNKSSTDGGGIYVSNKGKAYINAPIKYNYSQGAGGGIACQDGYLYLDSIIEGNVANQGGGVFAEHTHEFNANSDAVIRNNTASTQGGGIFVTGISELYLLGVKVTDNVLTNGGEGAGAGVYLGAGIFRCYLGGDTQVINNHSDSDKFDNDLAVDNGKLCFAFDIYTQTSGMKIGITTCQKLDTPVLIVDGKRSFPKYLFADNDDYVIYYDDWSDTYIKKDDKDGHNYYAIKLPKEEHGAINIGQISAMYTKDVTFSISAEPGYAPDFETVKVVDKDGNKVDISANADGTYTFTMPQSLVKIKVDFEEAVPTIKVKLSADATNPEFGTEYNEKLFNVQTKYFEEGQPNDLVVEWKQDDGSWSSSDANRPRGVKIDPDGMVHVSADASAGAYTFRVTNGLASGDSQFVKSKEITLTIEQKPEETPASGEGYVIDYDKETLRASDDSYEVSTTSGEAATALSADGKINPGQTYYVRKKASDENHKPSEWVAIETPEKAEAPNAGDIPRSDFVTSADGIKLSADSKYEFSLSGDAPWTSAGDTITGLDDGTPYTVYVRIKASGDAFPSEALELEQIYTKFKAPSSSDAGRTKVDYTNEKYHLEDGYEISTTSGDAFEDGKLETDGSGNVPIEPETTYYVRKAAITSADPEVPASDTFEFKTGERQPEPDVSANELVVTDKGITVPSGDGWEYMISGDGMPGEWMDENVFDNLDEATKYTIYVRTKASADADKFPSEKKEFTIFTEQTPPESGEGYHVDWDAETIEISGDAYEISTSTSDANIITGTITAEPGTTYYVRKKALTKPGDISASAWSEIKLPERPETPNLQRSDFNVADTEITLTSGDGLEYRISCEAMVTDDWQDLDVIKDLSAESIYTIIVRVKAKKGGFKSEESKITIKTKPAKPAKGEGFEIDFTNERFSLSDDSLYEISTTNGDEATPLSDDEKLKPGNTYYIRRHENTELSASAWQTIEVPNRPDAPTADELEDNDIDISVTKNSINIPSADGYEYRIDDGDWQDEIDKDSLEPESSHKVEIRKKSKPGEFASEPLEKEVWTKKEEPRDPSEGETINYQSEKFKINDGYEISTTSGDAFEDGKLETDGSGNAALKPGTTYYLRKAGEPSGAPASEAIEFTTPSRPPAPENAPAIAETGKDKIIVSAEPGKEYSIDGGNTWIIDNDGTGDTSADGQITFDNLKPGTSYTIKERTPATGDTFASEVKEKTVKTESSGGGGGGGGGGSEETPSEEFKQPADEDGGGLPVNANIENGKATIEDIPKEDIEKAAGNVDGWNPEDDAIIIDLSNAGQKVNEVEIPTGTLEEIGKALDSGKNSVDKLTVKMTESEVELDRKAVKEIIGEAGGDKISLVAQPKQQSQLNEKQKESLTDQKVEKIIDTYIESGGNKIQDLGKGSAYITIDFSPLAGTNPEGYRVYELKPDGTLVDCNSRYDDGKLTFKTSSLSTYVILCAGTGDQVLLKATASGKKAVKLSWSRIPKATKYVVYGAKPKSKYKKIKTLSSKKAGCKIKKIKGKKLRAHKVYKFYVVAYNGNVKVKKSNAIHLITARKMKRFGNVKSIRVRNAKITLKIGQREKFKVKYKIYGNKKHLPAKYGIKTTFFTNDNDIVKISRTGWVTGLKAGTANVYIQDIGGKYCMATVTVEK